MAPITDIGIGKNDVLGTGNSVSPAASKENNQSDAHPNQKVLHRILSTAFRAICFPRKGLEWMSNG